MIGRIRSISVDYEKGILLIDGTEITTPVKVTIKEPDGWDISKLLNHESAKPGESYSEIIIDTTNLTSDLQKKEIYKSDIKCQIYECCEKGDNFCDEERMGFYNIMIDLSDGRIWVDTYCCTQKHYESPTIKKLTYIVGERCSHEEGYVIDAIRLLTEAGWEVKEVRK